MIILRTNLTIQSLLVFEITLFVVSS